MRKALLLLLLLSGCATSPGFNSCEDQIGNPPGLWASYAFGAIGAGINEQTDEKQEWNQKMLDCQAKYKKANPS
jgi:hypothetical protein